MPVAAIALPALAARTPVARRASTLRLGVFACAAAGHLGLVLAALHWAPVTPRAAAPAPVAIAVLLPSESVPQEVPRPARLQPEPAPARLQPAPPPATRQAAPLPAPASAPAIAAEPAREPPPAPVALAAAPAAAEPRPAAISVAPPPATPPAPRVVEGVEPSRVVTAPLAPRVGPRVDASWSGNQPPAYPTMARRLGEEGEVRLDVHVGADGAVTEVRLRRSSGSELLDRTAIDTVRKWRFRPATVDGKPVPEWYQDWKWTFRLEG